MFDIQSLLAQHSNLVYLATFAWTALEGESFLIVAAYAAQRGAVDIYALTACAWIGSFLGDQFYFFLGRRYGTRMLAKSARRRQAAERALRLLDRYSTLFILSFRFIYGLRNVSSFAIGLSQVGWKRFAALNFVAAGVWAISFASIGYFSSKAMRNTLGHAVDYLGIGLLIAVIVGAVLALRRPVARRFRVWRGDPASAPAPIPVKPRSPPR